MITLSDIVDTYHIARRNKRRTADQTDFELHWEAGCVRLLEDIRECCLRPTAYTFIATRPKPREVFASDMATRILHHYIDIRLRPILERLLSPHTYNNRRGRGQQACQNALISDIYAMSEGFTRDAYIVKLDLKGYFPNISQDIAYAQMRALIEEHYRGRDKEELLYILRSCVFSYPTQHCRRLSAPHMWLDIEKGKSLFDKAEGTGAAIGHLLWQNTANWYLHEVDEWLDGMADVRYERYVDDIYLVIRDKAALALIPQLRERLSALGVRLNERKFYCQHWCRGVECLGVHIKRRNVYLNRRIVRRGIMAARRVGRPCGRRIDSVLSSLNSYIGFAKHLSGYRRVKDICAALPKGWSEVLYLDDGTLTLKARQSRRERIIRTFNLK